VPEKYTLAKRLAQCLNPSLPQGLHFNTLQIYETIFRHKDENGEAFDEDYGLYSAGIFPFFLYASPQNKPEVLSLLEKYYLPKRQSISLSLPGIVTCLLPALEDVGNPDLVVRIFGIFDKVCEFDRRGMYSAAWLALLRTPRARQGALIFFSKRLPKGLEGEGEEVGEYLTNRSLFLNALISGVNDAVVLVQRGTLDLIRSHFPLRGDTLKVAEKVELLKAILQLLQRRDFTVQRRIWEWTLPDQSEQQAHELLEFLIPALSDLFKEKPTTKEEAVKPLKIIEQLLENEVLVEDLLGDVTMVVLHYVESNSADRELSEDILHRSINLFTAMGEKKAAVWRALGVCLSEQLHGDVTQVVRSIKFYLCTFPLESNDDGLITPLLEDLLSNITRIHSSTLLGALQLTDLMLSRLHSTVPMDGPAAAFRGFFTSLSMDESKVVEEFRLASKICINLERHISEETDQGWIDCLLKVAKADDIELALVGMESLTSLLKNQAPCFVKVRQVLLSEEESSISRVVMQELWLLLDTKYRQRAVSLICHLQQGAPDVFAKTVVVALQSSEGNRKVDGIRKFATLWKYASEAGELAQLFMNGDGLFIMIDCLQHESPIVRHCAREWLLDSVEQLCYILDPLFDILAKPEREDLEVSRYKYTKIYDCPRTLDVIRKIKSVLLSGSDPVMTKAERQRLTPRVQPVGRDFNNYLELIVHYCSLYIESDPDASLTVRVPQFKDENHAVQASMCGLMELVLTQGTPSLAYKTVNGVLRSLEFSISSKDSVMQLLLLRQLRALFFNCNLQSNIEGFKLLLSSAEFSNVYLYSIFTPDLYVRTHWTQFLVDSYPLIVAFVRPDILALYLDSLIQAFCTLLHDCEDSQCLIAGLSSIVGKTMGLAYPDHLVKTDANFRENYPWIEGSNSRHEKKGFLGMLGLWTKSDEERKLNPFAEVLSMLFSLFDSIIEASLGYLPDGHNPQNVSSLGVPPYHSQLLSRLQSLLASLPTDQLPLSPNHSGSVPYTHTRGTAVCSPEFLNLLDAMAMSFPVETTLSMIRLWIKHSVSQAEPNELSDLVLVKLVKLCGVVTLDPIDCLRGCANYLASVLMSRSEEGNKVCVGLAHFLYCLFSELDLSTYARCTELWSVCIPVLKELENTNLAGMQCWLLELLQLITTKTALREVLTDRRIKKELQELVGRVVGKLTTVFRAEFIYSPIPPSVYSGTKEPIKEHIANLISMNSALYAVISSVWLVESDQKVTGQLQTAILSLLSALERKTALVDSELTAKLVTALFNSSGSGLVRAVRKQLLDFFTANDFFMSLGSNRFALKHWSRVSSQLVLYCYYERSELVNELISKIPSGVFVSKHNEKTQTAKILRTVGLMVYGGAVDDFAGCIFSLAEKLIEWLKDFNGSLLPLVLLTIRVLVFKLSPAVLTELWPRIWPHLMSEMLEILTAYHASSSPRNCQLVLACLKLLELMSLLNTEEFQLHQWVFFYDLFDIEFDVEEGSKASMFSPVVPASILPNLTAKYRPVSAELEIRNEHRKRSLIFTQQTVDNKTELEQRLRSLLGVLLISCTERSEVDQVSIETVLEEDLLSQELCL
jgi:hypothetical protein